MRSSAWTDFPTTVSSSSGSQAQLPDVDDPPGICLAAVPIPTLRALPKLLPESRMVLLPYADSYSEACVPVIMLQAAERLGLESPGGGGAMGDSGMGNTTVYSALKCMSLHLKSVCEIGQFS